MSKLTFGDLRKVQRAMLKEIGQCFSDCQGMTENDTKESDRYWELAEKLMTLHAKASGRKIRRKAAQW